MTINIETLKWWMELATANPQDLVPRISDLIGRMEAMDAPRLVFCTESVLPALIPEDSIGFNADYVAGWNDSIRLVYQQLGISDAPSTHRWPALNIRCETRTEGNPWVGCTYLDVLRVERQDDGSFTAVTNHWPAPALGAGWYQAVDRQLAGALIDCVDFKDDYDTANAKLEKLIEWRIAVAKDLENEKVGADSNVQEATKSAAEQQGQAVALDFATLRAANVTRCEKWHPAGIGSWSPSDWLTAAMGELGELASEVKMHNRDRDGLVGNKEVVSADERLRRMGKEAADVVIYLDLFCAERGIDLGGAIVSKFNEVSERVGFPDRIELRQPAAFAAIEQKQRMQYAGVIGFLCEISTHITDEEEQEQLDRIVSDWCALSGWTWRRVLDRIEVEPPVTGVQGGVE